MLKGPCNQPPQSGRASRVRWVVGRLAAHPVIIRLAAILGSLPQRRIGLK